MRMRSLKHYNKDDFILKLSNMSWESVLMCFDVEMAWDSFKTIFHSVLDSVAPVKEVKLKQRTEPWMNSEILQNIRFRDETLNKFRKTNDPDLYKKYCHLTRVGISGTTAKSRQRKFVPSSHPGPFAVVATSRKSQTKVGTLACFDLL